MKRSKLKKVALVGRRNVGKSTLFNALTGKRRAITDPIAGLTRDVLEGEVQQGVTLLLSDTPGLDIENPDEIETHALAHARSHIESCDLVLFLFEAPSPGPFDYEFLDIFRKSLKNTKVIFIVNKVDSREQEADALEEFYKMGISPIPVSALSRYNLRTLLRSIAETLDIEYRAKDFEKPSRLPRSQRSKEDNETAKSHDDSSVHSLPGDSDLKLALVGKPNAGKSSILNRFADQEVAIVSSIPGTTRDTVDSLIQFHGKVIRIIDTAGLRRNSIILKKGNAVDFYSIARAKRAIADCEVVLHVVDGTQGFTDYDKKISDLIQKLGKPCIIAINKWDAIQEKDHKSADRWKDRLYFQFPHARHIPVMFVSALSGQRLPGLLEKALELKEKSSFRISTGRLNRLVETWNAKLRKDQRAGKILYVTQASTNPPEFIFFISNKKGIRKDFRSYFENRLREECSLPGIPIKITFRERNSD